MRAKPNPHLPIFDTFKTKGSELTGEAQRQRAILAILSAHGGPVDRTRPAIAKQIAQRSGTARKNIYSGVFLDLTKTLIPLGLVEEEGRLPLKRGPKVLQESGMPYYRLTLEGMVVCLALHEVPGWSDMLRQVLDGVTDDTPLKDALLRLDVFAPSFVHSLIESYVRAYCTGSIEKLLPLSSSGLRAAADGSVRIQREMLLGFINETEDGKKTVLRLLDEIA